MPATLNNTTTTTKYTDCSLGGDRGYAFGSLTIANNPVSILVRHGSRGNFTETEYPYVTPTTLPLVASGNDEIVGVQIKSAIAASPAQVSGWLVEPNIAGIQPGAAFTSQVAASGSVTPGQSSVQIQKNGALIGTEPIIDFVDAGGVIWAVADDAANTRVTVAGSYPISTTVAALNTLYGGAPSNGDRGILRLGASPYSFVELVYDGTYAKWVSIAPLSFHITYQTNIALAAGRQDILVAPTAILFNWNDYVSAGLTIQARHSAIMSIGAASSATSRILYRQEGDGQGGIIYGADTAAVASNAVCATSGDWAALAPGASAVAHLQLGVSVNLTAGSGSVWGATIYIRFTS